jgi:hypothetical protein
MVGQLRTLLWARQSERSLSNARYYADKKATRICGDILMIFSFPRSLYGADVQNACKNDKKFYGKILFVTHT